MQHRVMRCQLLPSILIIHALAAFDQSQCMAEDVSEGVMIMSEAEMCFSPDAAKSMVRDRAAGQFTSQEQSGVMSRFRKKKHLSLTHELKVKLNASYGSFLPPRD